MRVGRDSSADYVRHGSQTASHAEHLKSNWALALRWVVWLSSSLLMKWWGLFHSNIISVLYGSLWQRETLMPVFGESRDSSDSKAWMLPTQVLHCSSLWHCDSTLYGACSSLWHCLDVICRFFDSKQTCSKHVIEVFLIKGKNRNPFPTSAKKKTIEVV